MGKHSAGDGPSTSQKNANENAGAKSGTQPPRSGDESRSQGHTARHSAGAGHDDH